MKYRLIAVLAASLVVAACAAPGAATTVTVTAPAPASTAADVPSLTDDEEYLMLLYSEGDTFRGLDTRTLVDLGHSICGALDKGYSVSDIGALALSSGITSEEAASLVAAAIVAMCPEHTTGA